MNRITYNELVNGRVREDINKLKEEIKKEKESDAPDKHKIMRMEEQKLIQGLFSNDMNGMYLKYRTPW